MKRTLTGACMFLGGCMIFSAYMVCVSFEGVVPSDMQGERAMSILLMLIGMVIIGWEAVHEKR